MYSDCTAVRPYTGHTGYLLGDEKESLLIWGDIVHFPHIQVAQPDVTIAFDSDPAAAAAIRSKVLDRAASDNPLSVVCTSTCLLPVRLSVKVTASH